MVAVLLRWFRVSDTTRQGGRQVRAETGPSASLMLLGLGERLAISVLLSGVAFLGVAWALA
jgi:hypothetical protein